MDVCLDEPPGLKRHYGDLYAETRQFVLLLSQLRQVLAAGQSGQMPMKHQQQPLSGVVFELMNAVADVRQTKRRGRGFKLRVHVRTVSDSEPSSDIVRKSLR